MEIKVSTEEKNEENLCTCRICGLLVMRIQQGKFESKNKKWVDTNGKQWTGRRCPDCVVRIQRSLQQERRANKRKPGEQTN